MEQKPSWEANSHSASQEMVSILCNPKFHYHVHKAPPPVSILGQMNPIHTLTIYLPKIHSNIVFPSTPRSSEWTFPFSFSNQNIVCISNLSNACYMPCLSYIIWLVYLIIFGEEYTLWSFALNNHGKNKRNMKSQISPTFVVTKGRTLQRSGYGSIRTQRKWITG
jgi:hypothetical protein